MNVKSKKGESVLEAVIAIVIISIVSVTALTLTKSSEKVFSKTKNYSFGREYTANVQQCFVYADGWDEFKALALPLADAKVDDVKREIVYESGSVKITVKVDYQTYGAKITVTGEDLTNNKQFVSTTYEKGGYVDE